MGPTGTLIRRKTAVKRGRERLWASKANPDEYWARSALRSAILWIRPKFWFTSETPLPSFKRDSRQIFPPPVTQPSSRKRFFAHLLGIVVAAPLGLKLFAKPAGDKLAGAARPATPGRIEVRGDPRVVARRADSI